MNERDLNENNNNLSMIDCGIKSLKDIPLKLNLLSINLHSNCISKIENLNLLQNLVHLDLSSNQIKTIDGLYGLISLKTLNLSCNSIVNIENLDGLKNLIWLNLSYNKIQYINGLSDLWGSQYSIETILLNGNFINSLEEVTYYLSGLIYLKHLALNENKFSKVSDYRPAIFSNIKSLISLDGKDKSNKILKIDSRSMLSTPIINDYSEFIEWNNSLDQTQAKTSKDFLNDFQNIKIIKNMASNKNKKTSKTINKNEKLKKANDPSNISQLKNQIDKLNNELKSPKLQDVEDKIHKLLFVRDMLKTKRDSSSDESIISSSSTPNINSKRSTKILNNFSNRLNSLGFNRSKKPTGILKHNGIDSQISMDSIDSNMNDRTKYQDENTSQSLTNVNNSINNQSENASRTTINEFKELMQNQLESYKQSQEVNLKMIADLQAKLESLNKDKQKCLSDKDDQIRKLNEENVSLSKQIETLKITIEITQNKFEQLELKSTKANEEKNKENIDLIKKQMKKFYQNELDNLNKSNELLIKQHLDKIDSLEKSYKSLEDEFRSALIIESGRYNELFKKYESINQEQIELNTKLKTTEDSEQRNKALIKELNDLIKEQKSRLQALSKLRKETTEDIQKRNEKLNEAVADCVKLKNQIESLKKEKKEFETNTKRFLIEYETIKKEKEMWNQKMSEQKAFLMQDNNRLTIENQTMISELELLRKNLEKERDALKINSKIIEDQNETIKKLKNGLVEKDDLIKKSREEALNNQKSLEKQLNEEMDLCNELQIKLEKSNERKETLKLELLETKQILDENKQAYAELTEKWKQKSDLISELDVKVRKMKENFENKEKVLTQEKNSLINENNLLNDRLRKIDDEFRLQYDTERKEHFIQIEKTKQEYEKKLKDSEDKIKEIENEMRIILTETANKKKVYEEKFKSFSMMFSQIQNEIEKS